MPPLVVCSRPKKTQVPLNPNQWSVVDPFRVLASQPRLAQTEGGKLLGIFGNALFMFNSAGDTLWSLENVEGSGVRFVVSDSQDNVYMLAYDSSYEYLIKVSSLGKTIWSQRTTVTWGSHGTNDTLYVAGFTGLGIDESTNTIYLSGMYRYYDSYGMRQVEVFFNCTVDSLNPTTYTLYGGAIPSAAYRSEPTTPLVSPIGASAYSRYTQYLAAVDTIYSPGMLDPGTGQYRPYIWVAPNASATYSGLTSETNTLGGHDGITRSQGASVSGVASYNPLTHAFVHILRLNEVYTPLIHPWLNSFTAWDERPTVYRANTALLDSSGTSLSSMWFDGYSGGSDMPTVAIANSALEYVAIAPAANAWYDTFTTWPSMPTTAVGTAATMYIDALSTPNAWYGTFTTWPALATTPVGIDAILRVDEVPIVNRWYDTFTVWDAKPTFSTNNPTLQLI